MSRERVVAVTGATGFLGRRLVVTLAREGARIRILARREAMQNLWRDLSVEIIRGNLEDTEALEQIASGADAIVHVAGLIKARSRAEFMSANRDGALAVAQAACLHAPAARFIAISSLAAREPHLSDYAASKRAGEEAVSAAFAAKPDRLVIVRPPMIYGPGDRETLAIFKAVSLPLAPIVGSGRIAIIHVEDAAAAIARLATGAGAAGCYALADPNPAGYGMPDLLAEAARALGHTPRFVRIPKTIALAAGTASALLGRFSRTPPIFTAGKAREMLHADWSVYSSEMLPPAIYESKTTLAAGFRETVDWYKAANWLP